MLRLDLPLHVSDWLRARDEYMLSTPPAIQSATDKLLSYIFTIKPQEIALRCGRCLGYGTVHRPVAEWERNEYGGDYSPTVTCTKCQGTGYRNDY